MKKPAEKFVRQRKLPLTIFAEHVMLLLRMETLRRAVTVVGAAALLFGALAGIWGDAYAQSPPRQTVLIEPYTEYMWWLVGLPTVLCSIPSIMKVAHNRKVSRPSADWPPNVNTPPAN
jgi:hypothetical protein